MSTNMGNLEKLGILVIVILVVVVGVVAITPKATVDDRLMADGQTPSEAARGPEPLEPEAGPAPGDGARGPQDPWPSGGAAPGAQQKLPGAEIVAADPAAAPAEAAPEFRTVKIQANDTLATIAKRELGSAARYPEIVAANPGLVATKLKRGQEIKIPVASAKAPAAGVNAPAAPVAVAPEPPAASPERIYVVKSGDTLSGIAGHQMGSKTKWTELQKANEDVLRGSTALKIGMKLRIPATDRSSGTLSDPAPAAPASPDSSSAVGASHEYVVKPGDSLWLIAKNELGSEKLIAELREANASVLKGSDSLKVGTKLTIPARK